MEANGDAFASSKQSATMWKKTTSDCVSTTQKNTVYFYIDVTVYIVHIKMYLETWEHTNYLQTMSRALAIYLSY
jgi:hypothetical protein